MKKCVFVDCYRLGQSLHSLREISEHFTRVDEVCWATWEISALFCLRSLESLLPDDKQCFNLSSQLPNDSARSATAAVAENRNDLSHHQPKHCVSVSRARFDFNTVAISESNPSQGELKSLITMRNVKRKIDSELIQALKYLSFPFASDNCRLGNWFMEDNSRSAAEKGP